MIFLIRDLDDPFEFARDGSQGGAAEVSLRPIERLEEHLGREVRAVADSAVLEEPAEERLAKQRT
jgi:hypothetical protein